MNLPFPSMKKVTLTPRDYQQDAIDRVPAVFGQNRGAMARMATGTGKTPLGCFIADWWLSLGDDRRVIVISYERQLVWQFRDEIADILGVAPGVEMGNRHVSKDDIDSGRIRVVVASRQTLLERVVVDEEGNETTTSRLYKFDNNLKWLVILDEVHRYHEDLVSCKNIFEWFDQNEHSRRLGLTATSERGDGKSLDFVCPAILADYPLFNFDGRCAVRDGWCVPYDQRFVVAEGVDFKNIKEVKGDFDDNELDFILNHEESLGKLIVPTMELAGSRRMLVFSPSVDMARNVARFINARYGENKARSLDGSVPETVRKDTYKAHKRGQFQVLSVCGLCREGYNDPGIQVIAIFRPTKSRVLAEQMKGRGCRTLRGLVDGVDTAQARCNVIRNSIKPNAMIIDLVGVTGLGETITTAHIVGAGKPPEVIERANKNMLAAMRENRTVMPGQEIAKAERQIADEERDAMRQQRLACEREAQEEANRRAKLQIGVRYKQHIVEQGDVGQKRLNKCGARFLFGKHAGKLIAEVPTWYLEMFLEKFTRVKPWLRRAVEKEFDDREPELVAPWLARKLRARGLSFGPHTTQWEGIKLLKEGSPPEPGSEDHELSSLAN